MQFLQEVGKKSLELTNKCSIKKKKFSFVSNMALEVKHSSFGQPSEMSDTLVIEISNFSLAFCELQSDTMVPTYVCEYPIDIESKHTISEHLINAIKHFQFSRKKYAKVFVNFFTAQFTLCPTALYHSEDNRALLEFNTGAVFNNVILVDEINADVKLLFAIEESIKSTLDVLFPQHQVKHTLTELSKLLLSSDELEKTQLLLSVHADYIELVVKQNKKLVLANQFTVKTTEDVLYYVLFVLEQYQLNPLTTAITLVGNIEASTELLSSLKKYIKHVYLGIGNKHLKWDHLKGMPQHFNYTLLNRIFCES